MMDTRVRRPKVASETDDYKTCPNNAVGGSPGPATDVPDVGTHIARCRDQYEPMRTARKRSAERHTMLRLLIIGGCHPTPASAGSTAISSAGRRMTPGTESHDALLPARSAPDA